MGHSGRTVLQPTENMALELEKEAQTEDTDLESLL